MENRPGVGKLRRIHEDRLAYHRLLYLGIYDRARAVDAIEANPQQPALATVTLFNDAALDVDLREVTSKELFMFGAFEAQLTAFFCRHLKEGMVFVDVGAHFGYFSVIAATLIGATGRVISFEPIEQTAHRLAANASRFPNIEIRRQAAWHRSGEVEMNSLDAVHSAFNSIAEPRLPPTAKVESGKVVVEAVTLDEAFPAAGPSPSVVKIDAESTELQVLQGMTRLLETVRPIVTVEVGDFEHLQDDGVAPSRTVLQYLLDRDYRLFDSDFGTLKPHTLRTDAYEYDNIIAAPREHPAAGGSPI